jgi:hypothetical protein
MKTQMNPNWFAEMVAELGSTYIYLNVSVRVLGVTTRILVKAVTVMCCYMELHEDKSPGEQQVLSSCNEHKHEDRECLNRNWNTS